MYKAETIASIKNEIERAKAIGDKANEMEAKGYSLASVAIAKNGSTTMVFKAEKETVGKAISSAIVGTINKIGKD